MSTLKTSNIQDTSGNNNSTPEQINQGRAKAWINFDGTSASIGSGRDSFNVGSVTDNGTGDYTVNFTTAMANANYAVAISGKLNGGSSAIPIPHYNASGVMTTTSMRFFFSEATTYSTKRDQAIVSFVAFGD